MLNITAPVATLLRAVEFAESAVERRHSLPILSHILLRATEDKLVVIGSDLEVEMEYRIPLNNDIVITQAGDITLPAQKLKQLLKGMPNDDVATLKPNKQDASKYQLSFKGLRSKYTLLSLSANDYPAIDHADAKMQRFSIDAGTFLYTLSSVSHATASNDVRYYLNGMQLQSEGTNLYMTTTDGHRMAQNILSLKTAPEKALEAILPRNTMQLLPSQLKGAEGDLQFALSENHIFVKTANADGVEKVIKSKLIDGRYPDWRRVLPKTENQVVTVDKQAFKSSLKRAAILSNEKFRGVRLTFDANQLTIESHNPENESAEEVVSLEQSADKLEIGVNVEYLLQAIDGYQGDSINLHLTDNNTSMVLRNSVQAELLNVIMPMRL
jgi:DNA polymerase-3 subunit beta